MRRALAVMSALLLKLVVAYSALYFCFAVYEGFAESRMGAGAVLDGYADGIAFAVAIVAAFAASSALAGAFAGRRRRMCAAAATALLFSIAGVVLVSGWLRSDEFRVGPQLIASESYVKYPPFRAAQAFQDKLHRVAVDLLLADAGLTLLIVFAGTRRRTISTASTSRAAS